MLYSEQVFLVAGLSRSGIAASEFLISHGAKVYVYDDVDDANVRTAAEHLKEIGCINVTKEELAEKSEKCDVLVLQSHSSGRGNVSSARRNSALSICVALALP